MRMYSFRNVCLNAYLSSSYVLAVTMFCMTPSLFAQNKTNVTGDNFDDTSYVSTNYTAEQLEKLVPAAKPEDVATPEAIVKALHQSVGGPKGDWNSHRLRSLCLPNVFFIYGERDEKGISHVKTISIDSFVKEVSELHKSTSWYEDVTETHVYKLEKKGHVLAEVVYSGWENTQPEPPDQKTLTSDPKGESSGRKGEATAGLIYLGNRWWITDHKW
jgi:hypothetical protein